MSLYDDWQGKCAWKWKTDDIDATYIDLGLDIDTNIQTIKLSQYNNG